MITPSPPATATIAVENDLSYPKRTKIGIAFESGQVSPACQIPMYYIQAAPLFSFVLVAFRIVQRWIIEFKIVIRKDEEKEEK